MRLKLALLWIILLGLIFCSIHGYGLDEQTSKIILALLSGQALILGVFIFFDIISIWNNKKWEI